MDQRERLVAIEDLIKKMNEKLDDYNECLKADAIFEVKKKLRLEIRQYQDKISELQQLDGTGNS
jgi:predicted DNA-binding protein YlxM (UPF0122 family)